MAIYPDDKTSVGIVKTLVDHAGVGENETAKSYIYPNPTNGNVYVKGHDIDVVKVYNVCGQEMVSVKANSDNVRIDLNGFNTGVYMLEIIDNQGNSVVNKVVKR